MSEGYFLGEHGFFDKRMMYEESSRMPFVISYPKKVLKSHRIDDLVFKFRYSFIIFRLCRNQASKIISRQKF